MVKCKRQERIKKKDLKELVRSIKKRTKHKDLSKLETLERQNKDQEGFGTTGKR